MRNKTRILVTHHLEVAKHSDMILVIDQGRITQQGTYDTLQSMEGTFKTLMEEHGNAQQNLVELSKNLYDEAEDNPLVSQDLKTPVAISEGTKDGSKKVVTKLHLDEEINTGAVSGKTFIVYVKALFRGGPFLIAVAAAALAECVAIALSLVLGFWTTLSFPGFSQGEYMSLYAGLGVLLAIFAFIGSYSTYLSGMGASFLMGQQALYAVLRSPVSFHDRTPSGRIISRLTKDVETLDERISHQVYGLLGGVLSIVGTVGLVFYSYTYLGILFIPMFGVYFMLGLVYARTARQLRRINSTMRSYVYSTFGEQLSGVISIRAYQQQQAFSLRFSDALDNEGRFYYTQLFAHIWLTLRLDLLGSILILGIGIFGVCFRKDVSPAKWSVVLTYSLKTTQASHLPARVRCDKSLISRSVFLTRCLAR